MSNNFEAPTSPEQTFTGDANYNQAVHRSQLITSDFLEELLNLIEDAPLTADAKRSLLSCSRCFCSKMEMLAKNDNPIIERLDAELLIAEARLSMSPADVDQPILGVITGLMLKHYSPMVSRSAQGWERLQQNRVETSNVIRQEFTETTPKEKKGFFRKLNPFGEE